jgi:hypothetical protein
MVKSTTLGVADGRPVLLDEHGRRLPDSTPIRATAGDLAASIASYLPLAFRLGVSSAAQPYAQAGANAGAKWALEHSVVRRKVERGANGEIDSIVEQRVLAKHDEEDR